MVLTWTYFNFYFLKKYPCFILRRILRPSDNKSRMLPKTFLKTAHFILKAKIFKERSSLLLIDIINDDKNQPTKKQKHKTSCTRAIVSKIINIQHRHMYIRNILYGLKIKDPKHLNYAHAFFTLLHTQKTFVIEFVSFIITSLCLQN